MATYRINGFSFNRANVAGIEGPIKNALIARMVAREREICTVETHTVLCADGPFEGQTIELSEGSKTATLSIKGWTGHYDGAKWIGTKGQPVNVIPDQTNLSDKQTDFKAGKGFTAFTDLLGELAEDFSGRVIETIESSSTRAKQCAMDDFGFSPSTLNEFAGTYALNKRSVPLPLSLKGGKFAKKYGSVLSLDTGCGLAGNAYFMDDFGDLHEFKNTREVFDAPYSHIRRRLKYSIGRTSYTIAATAEAVASLRQKVIKAKRCFADKFVSAVPTWAKREAQPRIEITDAELQYFEARTASASTVDAPDAAIDAHIAAMAAQDVAQVVAMAQAGAAIEQAQAAPAAEAEELATVCQGEASQPQAISTGKTSAPTNTPKIKEKNPTNLEVRRLTVPQYKQALQPAAQPHQAPRPDTSGDLAMTTNTNTPGANNAPAPTFYTHGNQARYTGKTQAIHGGTFYEFEFLEGARKGQTGVTQRAPDGTNPGQAQPEKLTGIVTPQILAPTAPATTKTAADFMGDIPASLAVAAYSGTSYSPERRGAAIRNDYAQTMAEDWAYLHAQATKGGTLDQLPAEFAKFRARMASSHRAWLASSSRCVSSFIAGGSNFPAARMNKRADIAHKRLTECVEGRELARRAAARNLRPDLRPIMSGDADAVDRLAAKIASAERAQQAMKNANKAIRTHAKAGEARQVAALMELGYRESDCATLLHPQFSYQGQGFASYSLTNNNANIRRMKERLTQIEAAQACEVVEIEGADGVRLEDDAPANRVRLFFPGKPSAEIRDTLKSNGFRWAPSIGAWQAYRNYSSLQTAQQIAGTPAPAPAEAPAEILAPIACEIPAPANENKVTEEGSRVQYFQPPTTKHKNGILYTGSILSKKGGLIVVLDKESPSFAGNTREMIYRTGGGWTLATAEASTPTPAESPASAPEVAPAPAAQPAEPIGTTNPAKAHTAPAAPAPAETQAISLTPAAAPAPTYTSIAEAASHDGRPHRCPSGLKQKAAGKSGQWEAELYKNGAGGFVLRFFSLPAGLIWTIYATGGERIRALQVMAREADKPAPTPEPSPTAPAGPAFEETQATSVTSPETAQPSGASTAHAEASPNPVAIEQPADGGVEGSAGSNSISAPAFQRARPFNLDPRALPRRSGHVRHAQALQRVQRRRAGPQRLRQRPGRPAP